MIHLIWDLDGTLIDSAKEVLNCLELAATDSGLERSKQIRPFIVGPTIDAILKNAFSPEYLTDDIQRRIIKNFRALYDNSEFDMTKPFPGIEEIVKDTTSFVHHVVTNKPDMPTKRILEKLGWTAHIATITTPYTGIAATGRKQLNSKSKLFFDLIGTYDEGSLFFGIGDMKSDCIAAKDNNIKSIGVLWGTGTREELSAHCNHLFTEVYQLRDFLYTCCQATGAKEAGFYGHDIKRKRAGIASAKTVD
jgi:phosphoglycolate phosphatase